MAITRALAIPALLAGAAYLNGKYQVLYDLKEIRALVSVAAYMNVKARRSRVNLFYLLESLARSRANHPFLVYQGRQWTYKEFYDTVLRYGTWLKQRYGIAKGEIVAMDFMNSPHFMFLWFGMWSIGASPAFINYNLCGEALLHTIKISGARLVIIDPETSHNFTPDVEERLSSDDATGGNRPVQRVVFNSDIETQVLSTQAMRHPDDLRACQDITDMALLIFTSGTTGMPKAAIISWTKIYRSGWIFGALTDLTSKDRYYTCMPLYHATAILACVGAVLFTGSTIILGHKFSTQTFWRDVRQLKATRIQYVGETCRYLLAAPPQLDPVTGKNLDKKHRVKLAFGNGLRPDIWERFRDRFGIETIAEFYGATEGPIAFFNSSTNNYASGAIGRHGKLIDTLLSLGKIALVEVDWNSEAPARDGTKGNFCKRVPRGEPGELLYVLDAQNPASEFHGYYRNPKASESKIVRDVFKNGDAFYRTGDVLRWDSEGRWWFVDRIGDTFRWKSENVATSEVAEALGTHPSVLEANVYGVSIPNHDGRAGCAALQLSGSGNANDIVPLMEDIATHTKSKLPKYAVPVFLRVVKEMDRTGTNKQTKARFREEGVDPLKISNGESLWWLKDGKYMPFGEKGWMTLSGGGVKL